MMLREFVREASFCGVKNALFAKILITHSFELLKNMLQACSESFNSNFKKEQSLEIVGSTILLARMKFNQW